MSGEAPVPRGALWFALLGGPLAWSAHLLASYPLVPVACRLQATWHLDLITAVTAAVAAAAGAVGVLAWRKLKRTGGAGAGRRDDGTSRRARFMAAAGAILGTFFLYVILVEGLPARLTPPC